MVLLKTFRSNHFYSFLRHQNTPLSLQTPPNSFANFHECVYRVCSPSNFQRNLSGTVQFVSSDVTEEQIETKSTDSENSESTDVIKDLENRNEVEQKKKSEEKQLLDRDVKANRINFIREEKEKIEEKHLAMYAKTNGIIPNRSRLVVLKSFKEFSPEIVLLVNRLCDEGYFSNANFLPSGKLDLNCFSTIYAREFLRSAAERFGQDHPEILKRLSLSDLERIARFGCPSVERKTAFAAKRLRTFFFIQEDITCQPCKLRSSCTVVNLPVRKRKKVQMIKDKLSLVDIMRVLTLYWLELVPEQLVIPNEIKDSIRKLLKEVVNNSQISHEGKFDASEQDQVQTSVELKPLKELSPDIVLLASRLYKEGYLKNANFLAPEKLDPSCFSSYYSRDFLRCASERFGQDHKEIMKSMSFSDLKTVARFGCPSVEKRTTIAAKRLRSFFCIQEANVCQTCKLKSSCHVMNQRVRKYRITYISFVDIMRVLTTYGLELVPAQLVIPDEIKATVNKLLRVVVNPGQICQEDPKAGA